MPEPVEHVSALHTVIPHFWFDVIGRCMPGLYFIVGAFWVFKGSPLQYLAAKSDRPESTIVAGLTFVFFVLAASYMIGTIMGHVSTALIEGAWTWLAPITGEEPENQSPEQVSSSSGYSRNRKVAVTRQQQLQSEYRKYVLRVWSKASPEAFATMLSKWDAEALQARSILLGSIVLFAASGWKLCAQPTTTEQWRLLVCNAAIGIGSAIGYSFYRRRRFSAYYLASSDSRELAKNDDKKVAGEGS